MHDAFTLMDSAIAIDNNMRMYSKLKIINRFLDWEDIGTNAKIDICKILKGAATIVLFGISELKHIARLYCTIINQLPGDTDDDDVIEKYLYELETAQEVFIKYYNFIKKTNRRIGQWLYLALISLMRHK
eukprot:772700_1